MPVKTFLAVLLLPPVNLVLAILVGVVLLRARPRFARALIGTGAVLLLLLAMPVVSGTLLWTLERGLPTTPPPDRPPGAIVILSAEVARTGGPVPGAMVGRMTLQRLAAGVVLARKTGLPILVSGGQLNPDVPAIAALMQESLTTDFQYPARWVEDRSRDTWQNARDSAAILHAAGIDSIYLVTHAWHERRALMAFAPTGLAVTVASVPPDRRPTPIPENFVPRPSSWLTSYYALHEWAGCLWYSL